jgi:signal transduction histidine kinase
MANFFYDRPIILDSIRIGHTFQFTFHDIYLMRFSIYQGLFALLIYVFSNIAIAQDSWQQIVKNESVKLQANWFTSKPFIYRDATGQLVGIEYELLNQFKDYTKRLYGVDVQLNWREAQSFIDILDQIKAEGADQNMLGVSAFSITEERKDVIRFTKAYMPDIAVLVSSRGTPIVESYDELNNLINELEAVTIKGTSYEGLLLELKEKLGQDFEVVYIESDQNILDNIAKTDNRFGFIDLPIYLMLIKQGGELIRQNYFTHRGTGYGLIMPKDSYWDEPINNFLSDPMEQAKLKKIYAKYLGEELYEFFENVEGEEQLATSLLTKEKELQLELIKNANLKLEEEQAFKQVLIMGIIIAILLILVIAILFYNNFRNTQKLLKQKLKIESQQSDIRQKNEQLVNRNLQLIALDEQRKHLMHVFAHDLRSPLNQIIGISGLLQKHKNQLDEEDQVLLSQIEREGRQINTMLSRILEDSLQGDSQSMVIKEQVRVHELVKEIVSRYLPIAAKKDIEIDVSICAEDFEFNTDYLLLFLVLENLLSNAIKFSPKNTRVGISSTCSEEHIRFEVSDEGPGFSDEDKLSLFQPFQQLSARPTAGEPSIGLGLSIVKRYINELGGKVVLESEKGKGANFILTIPR